ncbi:MAG: LPS export ABC transporter permease LptF [Desulfobacteraceae bacterium]|jgi:lipopolysaccharide export system permease protein
MKINTIITRYLFREMLSPFLINLVFFTFIFLMTRILDITNMVVNYQVSLSTVLLMLVYNMPFFMIYIIPMAVMMSVLLTFLRLSADNEIIAFKAGGGSISFLLPPVILFCLMGTVLTGWMSIYGLPWGRNAFQRLIYEAATSGIEVGLKERRFNDAFEGVTLYVKHIDSQTKELRNVFIEDRRNAKGVITIIAPKAQFYHTPGSPVFTFRLFNGSINLVNLEDRSNSELNFETHDLKLNVNPSGTEKRKDDQKDEEEMSLSELKQYLVTADRNTKQYHVALTEFHRKFAVPAACLALGLLAVPFGIQSKHVKRSFGLIMGLIFFLIYYLFLSIGWVLGEAGVYPPLIGMWLPNLIMGGAGIFFLVRTQKEKSLIIDEAIISIWRWGISNLSFLRRRFSDL